MYSELSLDADKFRLERIKEIKDEIITELNKRENTCKKYKKIALVTEILDSGCVMVSIALTSSGAATIIIPPLATGLGIAGGISGFLGLVFKFVSKKLQSKLRLNEDIIILSKSKLNTISDLISKALDDGEVSDEEFQLISKELVSFYEMKKEIKKKTATKVDMNMATNVATNVNYHRMSPSAKDS